MWVEFPQGWELLVDYINLNSEDDIPMWEHTVTAMVKIRTRNVSDSADVSWEIAKDDEEGWYVVSVDWDTVTNSDTTRIK